MYTKSQRYTISMSLRGIWNLLVHISPRRTMKHGVVSILNRSQFQYWALDQIEILAMQFVCSLREVNFNL